MHAAPDIRFLFHILSLLKCSCHKNYTVHFFQHIHTLVWPPLCFKRFLREETKHVDTNTFAACVCPFGWFLVRSVCKAVRVVRSDARYYVAELVTSGKVKAWQWWDDIRVNSRSTFTLTHFMFCVKLALYDCLTSMTLLTDSWASWKIKNNINMTDYLIVPWLSDKWLVALFPLGLNNDLFLPFSAEVTAGWPLCCFLS